MLLPKFFEISYEKARLFTQAGFSEFGKGAGIGTLHDGALNPVILKAVPSQSLSSKLRYEKARLFAQAGFSEYGGGAGI